MPLLLLLAALAAMLPAEDRLKKDHRWVHLEISLTDTMGKPVSGDKLEIEVRRALDTKWRLDDVKPIPQIRPGVYAGCIPMDPTDDGHMQAVTVRVAGFEPHTLPRVWMDSRRRGTEGACDSQTTVQPYRFQAELVRQYKRWMPNFESFDSLPESLRQLLQKSGEIEYLPVRDKSKLEKIGRLSGPDFDRPRTPLEEKVRYAKAALLNIHAVLRAVNPPGREKWAKSLLRLRRINEERIVAQVDPEMFETVTRLGRTQGPYACQEHSSVSAKLHARSFEGLNPNAEYRVVSVKTPLCQGSLQLTVAGFFDKGSEKLTAAFADIDIDQNQGIAHWIDAALQHNRKATNPLLIFDMIGELLAGTSIGYTLVPASR